MMKKFKLSTILLLAGILFLIIGGILTLILGGSSDETAESSAEAQVMSASVSVAETTPTAEAADETTTFGNTADTAATAEPEEPVVEEPAPEEASEDEDIPEEPSDTEEEQPEEPDTEEVAFEDVTPDSYCYDAVLWAASEGIASGTSDTTFSPDDTCTRAQIVTFLWRLAGEPEPSGEDNPFTDVTDSGSDMYTAIMWAVENGITSGTSDTTFSPDEPVTRAQAVIFLWRYDGEPDFIDTESSFEDVASEDFCYDAVMWAVSCEITSGTSNTTFSPDEPCTRGQVVTFLYRYAG